MVPARFLRIVFSALPLAFAGALAGQTLKLPDLTGTWKLDKDASDDPQKAMREAGPSEGARGGYGREGSMGGGGGGMGMGRGHGHGGSSGGSWHGGDRGESGEQGRPDWSESFAALETLQITDREPMLTITDAYGHERVVYTDGRKTQEEHSHGGTTTVRASWKDGHVQVVSTPETGQKVIETYAVAADGSQLTVTTTIEGGRRSPITILRIYDSARPGAPKTAPPAASPTRAPSRPDDDDDQSI
jgi:hypothetical protein